MSTQLPDTVDCACVIHGTGYDWMYVDRLYNMLQRNLQNRVRFHVYTEPSRAVPSHMIKHELTEWPDISGPRRSWWYKLQLFNAEHHSGNLLYFDLDTVIVRDISWIPKLTTDKFWTIRDFKYLQVPGFSGINSSIMWWNVSKYNHVWQEFSQANIDQIIRENTQGDQQYIGRTIGHNNIRFFNQSLIQSWRWQAHDGGMDFSTRAPKRPGAGTQLDQRTSVLVFHGRPKPHEINDVVIKQHWK